MRNTDFIFGLVVYTGHETKIMMNSTGSHMKKSKVEVMMNKFVIGMFIFMIILCLTASIYSACWDVLFQADTPYLRWDVDNLLESKNFWYKLLLSFGNWILIFVDFVPISLLVTMEGVKFW